MLSRTARRCRALVLVTALGVAGATLTASPGYAVSSTPLDRLDNVEPSLTVQSGAAAQAVAHTKVDALSSRDWRPPVTDPNVVVVGSGVHVAALPDQFATQVEELTTSGTTDTVGYGTWAAASILQLTPDAEVNTYNVYANGVLKYARVADALELAAAKAEAGSVPDAVVLAFPPAELLDPITILQNPELPERYRDLLDALADRPVDGDGGVYVGSPTYVSHRGGSDTEKAALAAVHKLVADWNRAREAIRRLVAKGVPVVAPAGDGGSRLQSIPGLSNLREVITVGSALPGSGPTVAAHSGTGPALDGTVKPDVLQEVATPAVVPPLSSLAKIPTLTKTLQVPAWIGLDWSSEASVPRGNLDSTFSAAMTVSANVAALHRSGVTDMATLRGALTAAAHPLPNVPVWRQGAGVLTVRPDEVFPESPPEPAPALVTGNLSLGLTPATGAWNDAVGVVDGTVTGGTATLTDFAGFDDGGNTVLRTVTSAEAPPTTVAGGSTLTLSATRGSAEPGLYCGYTTVTLDDATTEKVATCLVRSTEFYAESRYIHNEPAEGITYELVPTLPPAAKRLTDRPFMLLPVDPTHLPMYVANTQAGGCAARFPNGYPLGLDPHKKNGGNTETCAFFPSVAPGYYGTRLYSDYGAPVQAPAWTRSEIGRKVAYQKMSMWVLPSSLATGKRNPDGSGIDYQAPSAAGGTTLARYDGTTDTWAVGNLEDAGLRFAFGYFKRIVGTSIASRVVDLLDHASFAYESYDLSDMTTLRQLDELPGGDELSAWRWSKSATDATGIDAAFDPLYAQAGKLPIGVARYPITLPTPNYLFHASLNLKVSLTDAVVMVYVEAGHEVASYQISAQGNVLVPVEVAGDWYAVKGMPAGSASGELNLEFDLKSKGAAQGLVTIVTLPTARRVGDDLLYTGSGVSLSGMSLEYDTWTTGLWPQLKYCKGLPVDLKPGQACPETGAAPEVRHVFAVNPRHDARQVPVSEPVPPSDPNATPDVPVPVNCRDVGATRVCEDWTMLVHAPKADARITDVRDRGIRPDLPLVDSDKISESLLATYGVRRYDPADRTTKFSIVPILPTSKSVSPTSLRIPFTAATKNRFWDQVVLPLGLVAHRPGELMFRIENDVAENGGVVAPGAAPGTAGAAPLSAYVCYTQSGDVTFVSLPKTPAIPPASL